MKTKTQQNSGGSILKWEKGDAGQAYTEAIIGDFEDGDGVLFTLEHYPTCHRRGPWRLLIVIAPGEKHILWGCFDERDQPTRWYHSEETARSEAEAIAKVLLKDRSER